MEANVTLAYEWLNRNAHRSYPLIENGDPQILGNPLRNDILVDVFITIRAAPSTIFLQSINFTKKTVTVSFGDSVTGVTYGLATAILDRDSENTPIRLISPSNNASGHVIFGKFLREKDFGSYLGSFSFSVEDTRLESRCALFTGKPLVSSASVRDQDAQITDSVIFALSEEIEAEIVEATVNGQREYVVTLDLVNPENFLPDCYPKYTTESCNCGRTPIISINGVRRNPATKGVELVFGGGLAGTISTNVLRNLVALLVTQSKRQLCLSLPAMPDEYGRLGPNYDDDCPPTTEYGAAKGPPCSNPPPVIESCEGS